MEKYDISTPMFTLSGIKTYARLVDVYDGDTITCVFNIFGDNYYKFNLRLNGIDTAELKNKDLIDKDKALEARHKILSVCCKKYNLKKDCSRHDIQNYLKDNIITVWIECLDFDKYGRILVDIYKEKNDICLSEILLNCNLAYKYNGGTKEKI
jgi:endonuclease YncB( thermonuclease family)